MADNEEKDDNKRKKQQDSQGKFEVAVPPYLITADIQIAMQIAMVQSRRTRGGFSSLLMQHTNPGQDSRVMAIYQL